LNDEPILFHTVRTLYLAIEDLNIIIVLPEDQIDYWNALCRTHNFSIPHQIVIGGETRFHSVKNGLELINDVSGIVGVHDAVRPLVSQEVILATYEMALEAGNAIPVMPVSESIRKVDENGSYPIDRTELRIVQTPQCFKAGILKNAYEQDYEPNFTDDASVVEKFGEKIILCNGNSANIKITTPFDLRVAEIIINDR